MSEPVEGGLFIRNYGKTVDKLADSTRARRRIMTIAFDACNFDKFPNDVERELGVQYPRGYSTHERFFTECTIDDFLSSVTILLRNLKDRFRFQRIRDEFARVFREENLHYRIDDKGGVHFYIDDAFQRSVDAAIASLGQPKFVAAKNALEQTLNDFSGDSPSGKSLIRGVFESVESVFLVVANDSKTNRLSSPAIDQHFRPLLEVRYASVPEKADKIDRITTLIKTWVNTAHPFRHGAPFDQIHEAPLDYAVFIADQGMAILRFIIA